MKNDGLDAIFCFLNTFARSNWDSNSDSHSNVLIGLSIFSSHEALRRSHGIASLGVQAGALAAGAGVTLPRAVAAIARIVALMQLIAGRQHIFILTLRAGVLLLLGVLCRLSTLSGALAAAVLSAAVGMVRLLVPLVVAVRGARVVRALGGALIDLMTGGSRWHLTAMWRMHRLIPALHWLLQRQRRRRLHGRGQGITAVASAAVAATTRRLIFAHGVPLRGIVDMYVAGGHVAAAPGTGSRKIGR